MAYATPEQLAEALRIKVTPANTVLLEDCLEAAAEEIDHELDRLEPLPDPPPAMVVRTNVNRAVEWFKAADAGTGMIGSNETGELQIPNDGFGRYALTLRPLKERFGVG